MLTDQEEREALQRRIAVAKGYTDLRADVGGDSYVRLSGVLHADEGRTLVPRWPWDWCAAGDLLEEMKAEPGFVALKIGVAPRRGASIELVLEGPEPIAYGTGVDEPEAIANCWLAYRERR